MDQKLENLLIKKRFFEENLNLIASMKPVLLDGQKFFGQLSIIFKCKIFLSSYKNLGARMSLKIHFLHSHLDFFHKV